MKYSALDRFFRLRQCAYLSRILCELALSIFLFVTVASAGGFQVNEQSARGTAMGGAFVAMTNDASVLHLNPAGLSFVRGTYLSLGTTVIVPDYRFTGVAPSQTTTKMQAQVLFPPNFYLSHTFDSGLALAIAVSTPYSVRNEWDQDWVGSRITTHTEMRTITATPSVALKLSSALSLGMGVRVAFSRAILSRRIGFDSLSVPDGTESLEGDAEVAYGIEAGLMFKPNDVWSIGGAYRSRLRVRIEGGSANFTGVPSTLQASYSATRFSTSFSTPDDIYFGIGCSPFKHFYIEGNIQWALWSSFKELPVNYDNSLTANKIVQFNWRNTLTGRIGLEVELSDLLLRGGVMFDQSPVPDSYLQPSLPDADGVGYAAGIGYKAGEGLQLDFAYMYVRHKERTVTNSLVMYSPGQYFNGTYNSSANIVSLNVTYIWN